MEKVFTGRTLTKISAWQESYGVCQLRQAADNGRPPNMALQRRRAPRVPKYWFSAFSRFVVKLQSEWRVPLSFGR